MASLSAVCSSRISRAAAIDWIIANQLGRRNLTDEQKEYLHGKRYREEKKANHRPENKGANVAPLKTAEKLAKEYGVSPRTIHNDAKFSEAVDRITEVGGPTVKAEILSGRSQASKSDVIALAQLAAPILEKRLAAGATAIKGAAKEKNETPRKIGETFMAAVEGLSQRISGIRDQYGTVEAMFKSKLWETSDIHLVADIFHEVTKGLSKLDKEMQEYVRKHPQKHKA